MDLESQIPQDKAANCLRVLYPYAGEERKAGIKQWLQALASSSLASGALTIEVDEVDIMRSADYDLESEDLQEKYLNRIAEGVYDVVIISRRATPSPESSG